MQDPLKPFELQMQPWSRDLIQGSVKNYHFKDKKNLGALKVVKLQFDSR